MSWHLCAHMPDSVGVGATVAPRHVPTRVARVAKSHACKKPDVEEFLAQEAEQRKAEALRKALEAESKEKQKKAKKTEHNKY